MELIVSHVPQGFPEIARLASSLDFLGGEQAILHVGDPQKNSEQTDHDGKDAKNQHVHGVVTRNPQPQVFLLRTKGKEADEVRCAGCYKVPDQPRQAGKVDQALDDLAIADLPQTHDEYGCFHLPRCFPDLCKRLHESVKKYVFFRLGFFQTGLRHGDTSRSL